MRQKDKHIQAGQAPETGDGITSNAERLSEIRTDIDRIVTGLQDDLESLGVNDATEFMERAQQQGGQ